jgi:hypothetical protein
MIFKYIIIIFMIIAVPAAFFSYAEEEEEENPHTEMVDDQFVCLECHTDIPKEGQTSPTYFLVDDPSEHCLGCHEETQHAGTKEHEGQKAEPLLGDEKGEIACFTCHDPHPQGVIEGRTVYDTDITERNRKFIRLIVTPGLKERLGREVKTEIETEVYLREPADKICVSCHETTKKTKWRGFVTWEKFTRLFSY